MWLARAVSTERRLLEPIAELTERDGYLVYRSDRFPTFYAANGIEIRDCGLHRLEDWEARFRGEFDPAIFTHRTFTFSRVPELEPLADEAREAGYDVTLLTYLVATSAGAPGDVPDGLTVDRIASDDGWERMGRFDDENSRGSPWYQGPESTARLLEKTRSVSERIGIEWLALVDGQGAVVSKLGLFRHGPVYRLQDVGTLPDWRRRGLSSYLLRLALARALDQGGAEGLVVAADTGYHAIDLYRKLGFREVGETVEMMRYPPA